jgi:hypothetical protein
LWRHLAAGGLDKQEERLLEGLKELKTLRDGKGRWRRFPFYYTLLTLIEIDSPLAREEIRYASKVCERYLKRSHQDDKISRRRNDLIKRALARC